MATPLFRTAVTGPRAGLLRSQLQRRTYATAGGHHPHASHGGTNRNVTIGLAAIAIPTIAWFGMSSSGSGVNKHAAAHRDAATPPGVDLDPVGRSSRIRDDQPERLHPEHQDPELKPAFGVVHKQKRVDDAPDSRNHQALQDRGKHL